MKGFFLKIETSKYITILLHVNTPEQSKKQ